MKTYKILFLLLCVAVCMVSCDDDDKDRNSIPVIESLTLSKTESIMLTETMYFDAKVSDLITPLSTLEVEMLYGGNVLSHRTIRTKGNEADLTQEEIYVPFLPNMEEGKELSFRFTLINIDGNETVEERKVKIKRPELPQTLYIVISEDETVELVQSAENPYLYASAKGEYKNSMTFKLATEENLEEASFIWNVGGDINEAAIGERLGEDIELVYPTWIVDQIFFDALSFTFTVDGENIQIYIKDTMLAGKGSYFYANISFTQGEQFAIEGIEKEALLTAYNRDFFSYDAENDVFTFLRASGTWEIYYFMDVNYFFVMRMDDVAPVCYWIVGHGFTSAPVWNADHYGWEGWDTGAPHCLGYLVPIGGGKYQISMYINNVHAWDSFEFEIYSNRDWSKDNGIVLTDASLQGTIPPGIEVSGSGGLTGFAGSDFVPGYYRLVFDTSAGTGEGKTTVTIERIAD